MKTVKATLSLLLLSSASAIAADLTSIKSAPTPAPMWTGFYAGLNAGGTWATNNNVHVVETPAWFNPNLISSSATTTAMAALSAVSSIAIPMQTNPNFIGGLQAGYNEKIFDKAVIGVETDFQGVINTGGNASTAAQAFGFNFYSPTLNRTVPYTIYNLFSASKSLSYLGTVRGRAGYLITPSLFVYLTGGLAYGGVNFSTFPSNRMRRRYS